MDLASHSCSLHMLCWHLFCRYLSNICGIWLTVNGELLADIKYQLFSVFSFTVTILKEQIFYIRIYQQILIIRLSILGHSLTSDDRDNIVFATTAQFWSSFKLFQADLVTFSHIGCKLSKVVLLNRDTTMVILKGMFGLYECVKQAYKSHCHDHQWTDYAMV